MQRKPHVVIIGGGFGGLAAARELAKAPVTITLLDRRNHHLFQPMLYQVATAGMSAGDISYPIRAALADQANARVLLAAATSIDVENRKVVLDNGELAYDYLIVATGATHSYFGRDDWANVAPGLKSIEDALEIRRRIFLAYEAAEREADPAKQQDWLTFAVVGAGPTGVELAGALGEIGMRTLAKDFRHIDSTKVRVVLFEGRDRILGTFPDKLATAAQHALEERQVDVRLNSRVTAVDARSVTIEVDGKSERIGTRTVLWAAGVRASPLAAMLGAPIDPSGRVAVDPDLSIPAHPEVFAIGDLARIANPDGSPVPGVAQAALQAGRHVAQLIASETRHGGAAGKAARPAFRYRDKGNMATVGRGEAVVATRHYTGHGLMAWLLWWVVHIMFLIGFRNRLFTMFHWAWSWLTHKRGTRLITGTIGALPAIRSRANHGHNELEELMESTRSQQVAS